MRKFRYKLWHSIIAFLIVLLACGTTASASLLKDNYVGYQYYFSDLSQPYDSPEKFYINPIINYDIVSNAATLTVSDTQIIMHYHTATHYNGGPFNGFVLFDINGTIADFLSFTIDSVTNMTGFNTNRITLDENSIAINFQNLSFTPETVVSISLIGATIPIPEPSIFAILALLIPIAGVFLCDRDVQRKMNLL